MCSSYESIIRIARFYVEQQPTQDPLPSKEEEISLTGNISTYSLSLDCQTLNQADIIDAFNAKCNLSNFQTPKASQKIVISSVRIIVEKHASQVHNIIIVPTLWNTLMGTDLAKQNPGLFSPDVSFSVSCSNDIRRISKNGVRFFFTTELRDITKSFNSFPAMRSA